MGKGKYKKHNNNNSNLNNVATTPISDSTLEEIKEKELKAAREKSKRSYDMEVADEIVFDDLNSDMNLNSDMGIDSIIENLDMSDHRYRF